MGSSSIVAASTPLDKITLKDVVNTIVLTTVADLHLDAHHGSAIPGFHEIRVYGNGHCFFWCWLCATNAYIAGAERNEHGVICEHTMRDREESLMWDVRKRLAKYAKIHAAKLFDFLGDDSIAGVVARCETGEADHLVIALLADMEHVGFDIWCDDVVGGAHCVQILPQN